MSAAHRLLSFALVPLSALPLVAAVPQIAPSVQRRVHELRAGAAGAAAGRAAAPVLPLRTLAPPTWAPTRAHPHHRASRRAHHQRRR